VSFASLGADSAAFELAPGAVARSVWGEKGMLNVVELQPGATVAFHAHPHEQLGLVLTGSITMTVGGATRECGPMDAYVVPGDVEHGATAGPQGATVVDAFVPVREDYRERAGGGG
jgi:quercetin dioxygenase-like cupin family protein